MKALVVDDSALMRRRISQILAGGGFEVRTARHGLDALEQLEGFAPDVVTLDVNMPEMDGLTCLSRIMTRHPLPVVMISSLTGDGALATLEAIELGAFDYVEKPGGTVSVEIDSIAATILAKAQAAATAGPRRALRLRDRLRSDRERISRTRPPARREVRPTAEALVLIGASTGGPAVLEEILAALDPAFPLPILICQHMPASITSHFAQRLDRVCALPVVEVRRLIPIEPGRVHLGRGDADLVVMQRGNRLVATSVPSDQALPWHPSVARLVESAQRHVTADSLIGVMLTGMGDDGAEEMAALCRAGGRTVAESEESAVVFGMPGALVARGGAREVLPADRIAERIARWADEVAILAQPTQRSA